MDPGSWDKPAVIWILETRDVLWHFVFQFQLVLSCYQLLRSQGFDGSEVQLARTLAEEKPKDALEQVEALSRRLKAQIGGCSDVSDHAFSTIVLIRGHPVD